jgi:hypothetical protein
MHVLLGKLLELVRMEQDPLRVFPTAHFHVVPDASRRMRSDQQFLRLQTPTLDVGWEKITALNIVSGLLTATRQLPDLNLHAQRLSES